MAGVNKVILVGNLGRDPEVRHLDGDVTVATFSIATTETYNDREGNRREETQWHNIVLWRGLAKIAERYLKKGSKIYIEGKLTHRSYEHEGQTRYITEIVGRELTMLDSRPTDGSGGYVPPAAADAPAQTSSNTVNEPNTTGEANLAPDAESDDLPF